MLYQSGDRPRRCRERHSNAGASMVRGMPPCRGHPQRPSDGTRAPILGLRRLSPAACRAVDWARFTRRPRSCADSVGFGVQPEPPAYTRSGSRRWCSFPGLSPIHRPGDGRRSTYARRAGIANEVSHGQCQREEDQTKDEVAQEAVPSTTRNARRPEGNSDPDDHKQDCKGGPTER